MNSMVVYIAFLRGINVGGHKKIKMQDLRDSLRNILGEVETYIQSGNIIFQSSKKPKELEQLIAQNIKKAFSYEVPVKVVKKDQLKKVLNAYPFPFNRPNEALVVFLSEKLSQSKLLDHLVQEKERYCILEDVVYLHLPNGSAHTKLNNNNIEKALGVAATGRNIRTIEKIIQRVEK